MMPPRADSATLNVQPRQRRAVYVALARQPAGRSVRELLDDCQIPESELRETLRKLDRAGLARRSNRTWEAIPLEPRPGIRGPDRSRTIRANRTPS
jgi:predicted ArsR family transcriptional regulator